MAVQFHDLYPPRPTRSQDLWDAGQDYQSHISVEALVRGSRYKREVNRRPIANRCQRDSVGKQSSWSIFMSGLIWVLQVQELIAFLIFQLHLSPTAQPR